MVTVLAARLWFVASILPQPWEDYLVASWQHHDTLHYALAGTVLISVCWWGAKREWRLPVVVASGMAGLICVLISLGIGLLGDFARNDHGTAKMVSREIRMSHIDNLLPTGADCRVATQCVLGAVCVRAEPDNDARCWKPCFNDGCPVAERCVRGSHRSKVCVPQ